MRRGALSVVGPWPGVLVAVAALVFAAPAAAVQGDTDLISRSSSGAVADYTGYGGPYDVSSPAISADGRYVGFKSHAGNLAPGAAGGEPVIFVRDTFAGTTERIAIAITSTTTQDVAISADARFVAITSDVPDLVPGDVNGADDVFVVDRDTDTVELVSIPNAGGVANGGSGSPAISADGRIVAFASAATNLVTDDLNGETDIFVRDRDAGTTERVSIADNEAESADAAAHPSISADGRRVAFDSPAGNLVFGDTNGTGDAFVRDRVAGKTVRVSVASLGAESVGPSSLPAISADGTHVAFRSVAPDLVAGDTNAKLDTFVHELDTENTERASLSDADGQLTLDSFGGSISGDGRYVTFGTEDDAVVQNNPISFMQLFVRDRDDDTTTLVSVGSDGTFTNSTSTTPLISANGRYVAFESFASNLAADDTNGERDIFRHTYLPAPPLNLVKPVLTGTPEVGQTLLCSAGDWSDGTLSRRWRRNGVNIPGATGPTYTLAAADAGASIDCVVTATNGDGFTPVASNAVAVSDPDGPDDPDPEQPGDPAEIDPIEGEQFASGKVTGTVRIRRPGDDHPVILEQGEAIPVGSTIDAREGRVTIRALYNGESEKMTFFKGIFKLSQPEGKRPYVTAKLAGRLQCGRQSGAAGHGAGVAAKKRKGKGRRLWAKGKGHFRTKGRRASATVRGTKWLTWDRCDGSTLVKVKRGRIVIDDFARRGRKDKVLKAKQKGRSRYIAKG